MRDDLVPVVLRPAARLAQEVVGLIMECDTSAGRNDEKLLDALLGTAGCDGLDDTVNALTHELHAVGSCFTADSPIVVGDLIPASSVHELVAFLGRDVVSVVCDAMLHANSPGTYPPPGEYALPDRFPKRDECIPYATVASKAFRGLMTSWKIDWKALNQIQTLREQELVRACRTHQEYIAAIAGGGIENEDRQKTGATRERTPEAGSGVAPRNAWFLQQYEACGTETYHKPAKIHAKWDSMSATARATICPDSPSKVAKSTVESIIKRAVEKTKKTAE